MSRDEKLTHPELVRALCKPGAAIAQHLTTHPVLAHLWHMAPCLAGEAGEIMNTIKKMAIYEQPLTQEKLDNLIEELGDAEFYIEGIRQGLTELALANGLVGKPVTREDTLEHNIDKLTIRYGKTYSNEAATLRKDKPEESN